MKIKSDFVTNSSSTSYVCAIHRVVDKEMLRKFLKDEYGKLGEQIFEKNVVKPDKVEKDMYLDEYENYLPHNDGCTDMNTTRLKEELSNCIDVLFVSGGGEPSDPEESVIYHMESKPDKTGTEPIYQHSYYGYNG